MTSTLENPEAPVQPKTRLRTLSEPGEEACPQCGSQSLVRDSETGEVICTSCGFVLADPSEEMVAPPPRVTEEGKLDTHMGPAARFSAFDKNLSTLIGEASSIGRRLTPEERQDLQRLRRLQMRTAADSSQARNLRRAMAELRGLAGRVHLPDIVVERAALLYRRALNAKLVMGRPIASMATACLYAACRSMDVPRSLKEMAEVSGQNKKRLAHYYRVLIRTLDVTMPIEDPIRRLSKVASRAKVDPKTEMLAGKILREAIKQRRVAGRDPTGLAAAAIHLASRLRGDPVPQKLLADAAGVTEVTIRNRLADLKVVAALMNLKEPELPKAPASTGTLRP